MRNLNCKTSKTGCVTKQLGDTTPLPLVCLFTRDCNPSQFPHFRNKMILKVTKKNEQMFPQLHIIIKCLFRILLCIVMFPPMNPQSFVSLQPITFFLMKLTHPIVLSLIANSYDILCWEKQFKFLFNDGLGEYIV